MKILAGRLRPAGGGEAQPLEAREVPGAPCCQSTGCRIGNPEVCDGLPASPWQIGQTWMHPFLSAFCELGFYYLLPEPRLVL